MSILYLLELPFRTEIKAILIDDLNIEYTYKGWQYYFTNQGKNESLTII